MRALCLCSLILTLLVSCSSDDGFKKSPETHAPKKWQSSDNLSRTDKTNMPLLAWWQTFHDAELSLLIEKALKNNNEIQAAVGNVLAAQGQLEQINYSWIPSINAIFSKANTGADMLNSGYSFGLLPSSSFNFLQLIHSKKWAKANLAVATAAEDAVKLSIISQTVSGYFTYLEQTYLLQQQQIYVNDLQALLKSSQTQYEQGMISYYTLQQYEQQYHQAKADLLIFKHNHVAAANALKLLLNENPGTIDSKTSFMQLKSNGIIPINLPSQVLRNRPDVREAEAQLSAAHANVDIASATFFPTISLTSAAATSSDALNGLFASENNFWHYQLALNMPLLEPEVYGEIKQAKGQYYNAYYHYIQTVRIAFQSVDDDLSAHQLYYESYIEHQKNKASAQKAYELAKIGQRKGLYSYPTLLNNKIILDHATIDLAEAKLAQLLTIVKLYQDLGGGYAYNRSTNDKENT